MRREAGFLPGGVLALILLLPQPGSGQHRAATEAELGWRGDSWSEVDPLRSEVLAHVGEGVPWLHGSEHLRDFLREWRGLLDGITPSDPPLNILHFGGSHVQAGRIGWAFRQALMEDRPGILAVPGVLPPYRLAGENGPPETQWASAADWQGQRSAHRRHQGDWGLTGMEVTATVPDTIRLWNAALADCPDQIHLLSRPGEGVRWTIIPPDAHGQGDTLLLLPPDSGAAHLQGIQLHHPEAGLIYHDLGGNGASTAAWLRHPHLVDQLSRTPVDLAILAWGINDAHMSPERFSPERFKQRYVRIIDSLRTAIPDLDILLVTNNDSHYRRRHNPNAERVREVMLELVDEQHVGCWDLYQALGGPHSIDRLHAAGFAASDRLHFNRNGYVLLGELLYTTLTRAAFRLP